MRSVGGVCALLLAAALPLAAQQSSPLSLYLATTGMYDSNIEHDASDQQTYGGAVGLGLGFERNGRLHAVEAQYEVAAHRYATTDRWNRISQQFEGAYTLRPARWLRLQTGVEVSLKGNSEDRDLGNQYAFKPRLELRPTRRTAIRFTGAYRIKQDESERAKDANNTYLALEVRQRHEAGGEITLGVRQESNRSNGPDDRYRRTLYTLELSSPPAARDVLGFTLNYREQRYRYRQVDVDGASVLRRDQRVTAGLEYTHRLSPAMAFTLGYEFETRGSNDPRKEYVAHLMSIVVRHQW
ncbi:MAG: hypothetical protein SGJ01_17195 [Gemmatimonadota bacterium]|nr:hypothetical protein [Gemmatimonadota bacterium]